MYNAATIALVQTYYEGADRQRALSYWSIGSWGDSGVCSFVVDVLLSFNVLEQIPVK